MKRPLCISLFALLGLVPLKLALAQMAISVSFAPPALPVYQQPPCPEDGSIWVPGYWAWDADFSDYYWVPGTWVPAPEPGYLWTPPYWGWNDGAYVFNQGYWATEVGFYGGVNYGFGYFGHGFGGGRWDHDHFYYNTAVMNVNTTVIHNVYVNRTVIVKNNVHVSYNGGQGGIQARPTQQEEAVARMRHVPPSVRQEQRIQMARSNPQMRASANHGRPPVAATERPTEFSGRGVVQAKAAGAPYHPPVNRPAAHGAPARPSNETGHDYAHPENKTPKSGTERPRPTAEAPERPAEKAPVHSAEKAPARPAEKAPAHPKTHESPARPAPEKRPAPAEHEKQLARPKTKPEPAPRPQERTEQKPARQHPAPETHPETSPRQEKPAPKTEEHRPQAQKPAPKPKPESKPKPEEPKQEPK
ncbi:MAG: hypothetical protein WCF17_12410 [Terracidiphilus sp.]